MKSICNLIDDIMLSENLIDCGENMMAFAERALREKNRAKLVQEFKRRLSISMNATYLSSLINKPDYYYICGSSAVSQFLALRINPNLTPTQLIKSISTLGLQLLDEHLEASERYVTEDTVREIIAYLNLEYNFTQKIYGTYTPIIILNHNSHKNLNGFQPVSKLENVPAYIFLYHLMHGVGYSPEYVLLHE